MAIQTFTSGQILTASDTNTYLANSGLVYVGASTLSSVTNNVTSVFSASFDNYRVVISGLNNASGTVRDVGLRMLSGTTPNSTASSYTAYKNLVYSGPTNASEQSVSDRFELCRLSSKAGQSMVLEFYNPFLVANTAIRMEAMNFQSNLPSYTFRQGGGAHEVAASYDGFQIIGQTDNLSGTVRVYGYRQA
jgi:hypothetical protein